MQNVERTLKFEIDKSDKAVLILKSESGKDTTCLIDTGANVPIWFMGERFLQLRYPSAHKTDKLTIIHGLGKEPLLDVPVWIIPSFEVEDDIGEKIVYKDMPIPVINAKQFSFNMLIPLTMLNRMKFSLDYKQSVQYAYFSIEVDKNAYYIRAIYSEENQKYLSRIQVFYQDDPMWS